MLLHYRDYGFRCNIEFKNIAWICSYKLSHHIYTPRGIVAHHMVLKTFTDVILFAAYIIYTSSWLTILC